MVIRSLEVCHRSHRRPEKGFEARQLHRHLGSVKCPAASMRSPVPLATSARLSLQSRRTCAWPRSMVRESLRGRHEPPAPISPAAGGSR
jgi:hypothetical protein